MARQPEHLSENSRKIARNTLLLYFRMLLLMLIGLFTSRVILRALGVEDYGVYNVVGGIVTVFTFVTSSISTAISRFLAFELGKDNPERLRRIFSTGIVIQAALSLLLVLLVETAGMWWLENRLVIPEGRLGAARFALHCSLGALVANMLSVPYNATIIAREKMSAFAWLSILEAVLKLAVALALGLSGYDKLRLYALLMFVVALTVRGAYGIYCGRHFPESRGRLSFELPLLKEMCGFALWSFFGASAYILNTQGVNQASNVFFGVAVNAARGVAAYVEGIVRQFVSSLLTAMNPQITKSWASGDRDYCFSLVRKGARFTLMIIMLFFVPFSIEAEKILDVWFGAAYVPASAPLFVRLTLLCLIADLAGNSVLTLVLATGDVRRYYLLTGLTSYLCLPAVCLAFRLGAGAAWAYWVFFVTYTVVLAERLAAARRKTGFPLRPFAAGLLRVLGAAALAAALPLLLRLILPKGWTRLIIGCAVFLPVFLGALWAWALTDGERLFVLRKAGHFLPDSIYLRDKYSIIMGRRLWLDMPQRFTEKLQWLKLNDRNPLYHRLVDKVEVKGEIAERIGKEYIVPTLGVWDSPDSIDWDSLPDSFVLKCSHDSGSIIICRDKATFDREAAVHTLRSAMKSDFYRHRDREWAYKGLRPRVMAEVMLEDDIRDYKFFCFNGEPRFFKIDFGRFSFHRANYYSPEGTLLRFGETAYPPDFSADIELPDNLGEMLEIARRLSEGIPFVRVDLYNVGGRIYFGEMTFYPASGLGSFLSDEQDLEIGRMLKLPKRRRKWAK